MPQVVEFLDFFPSGMNAHFILYRKYKIRTVRKKSGWLVTLPCIYVFCTDVLTVML